MKKPAIYSFLLHLGLFLLIVLGLPSPFHKPLSEQKPMMIEFVNIADFTQAPLLAPQDVQEPNQNDQPQQPEPEPAKPEPTPEEPKPIPEPQPDPEPVVEESKPQPVKEPGPEPEPLLMPEEAPQEKPKLEPKPELKEEPKKVEQKKEEKKEKVKEKVEVDLTPDKKEDQKKKDAEKKKKEAEKKKKEEKAFEDFLSDVVPDDESMKKKPAAKSSGKTKGAPADRVGDVVTASPIDAIMAQLSRCWIVPRGARGAKDLAVKVELKVNRNGTVIEAKVPERGRLSDPVYRAAAESVQRAALDPKCNPLPVDLDKYEEWKEMRVTFNPAAMY